MAKKVEVLRAVMVPVKNLHPNDWNPNVQSEATFEGLKAEIERDGFGHPLGVVPVILSESDAPGDHYRIIEGEHRWRAAVALEMSRVPCYIYTDWDETTQKLKTVRRNLLTGSLDAARFTALVRSLEDRVDSDLLPGLLGFESRSDFSRYLVPEMAPPDAGVADMVLDDPAATSVAAEREARMSIQDIVTSLFLDSVGTVDQCYLVFAYRGAAISVVLCDDNLAKLLAKTTAALAESGESAVSLFARLLEEWL